MAARDDAAATVLAAAVTALLGVGAVMIFSTTARGNGPLLSETFLRQMTYVAFGLACALVLIRLDYHLLLEHRGLILAGAAALLALVLVPGIGHRANGASRWLRVGPVGFQPSEPARLALIVFLAGFLARRQERISSFTGTFLPAAGATGLVCVLVLLEPDIGTTVLLGAVACVVMFAAGCRLAHFAAPVAGAIPVLAFVVSRGYARARIEAWLDPWKDPSGAGYHIIQSLVAIGSGGLFGKGLGASQQKLYFLPEAQTDFIFAILAEEFGLVGVTAVLALYAAVAWAGLTIARRAADTGGRLLAAGVTAMIVLQALTNVAVATKVLPTKGIALPFISAGGSSVVVMTCGVALLFSVARRSGAAGDAGPAG